ncbi:MAG TPA: hypothetical protein VHS58_02645 [Acetobacteraceae bacterium]|jgi:hypothetical protein|nr:hypothetical protein [Acetobacteraceae bacterium]
MSRCQPNRFGRVAVRAICLVIAAVSLAGCVIVPARPYHPWPRYYYYP